MYSSTVYIYMNLNIQSAMFVCEYLYVFFLSLEWCHENRKWLRVKKIVCKKLQGAQTGHGPFWCPEKRFGIVWCSTLLFAFLWFFSTFKGSKFYSNLQQSAEPEYGKNHFPVLFAEMDILLLRHFGLFSVRDFIALI